MELKKYEGNLKEFKNMEGYDYLGYWRMYYNHSWGGRWFSEEGTLQMDGRQVKELESEEIEVLNNAIKYIVERWKEGCTFDMIEDLKGYNAACTEYRHLLEMKMDGDTKNLKFIVLFDVEFGNGDYPVRIYVYRKGA